ncbi:MAG: hypothetical protein ACP5SD_07245 [Elusimicrobiales bacterium]
MKIIGKVLENISFFALSKITDILIKKTYKETESEKLPALERLAIEQSRLLASMSQEVEKLKIKIENLKTLLYGLLLSNIVIIILFLTFIFKK